MSMEELGKNAYQKAILNDFEGSIEILDKAIIKYPNEPRLYNNRTFCYSQLKDYNKALDNSVTMITLFPTYPKSFYRMGEAYLGLNSLEEAESCFQKVLSLDRSCDDAREQLLDVQISLMCLENGSLKREDVETALKVSGYNRNAAKCLLPKASDLSCYEPEIYYSDDETDNATGPIVVVKEDTVVEDAHTDPKNPYQCTSVWVGNITKNITEDDLKTFFSKYGKIKSVSHQYGHCFAFVNFAEAKAAGNAMRSFAAKDWPLKDAKLTIRFPDYAIKNSKIKKRGTKGKM